MTLSKILIVLAFCMATGIAVPLLYEGLFTKDVSSLESVAVYVYGVAWYICLAMFGGLHGAPAWSEMPAATLAVIGENLTICWAIFRLLAILTRHKLATTAK